MDLLDKFAMLPGNPLAILEDRNLSADPVDLAWAATCEADYVVEFMQDGNSVQDFQESWGVEISPGELVTLYRQFAHLADPNRF